MGVTIITDGTRNGPRIVTGTGSGQKPAVTAESPVSAPYIDEETGTWWAYDKKTRKFVDTGISAQGPQGETGPQGPQGIQGDVGPAGPHGTLYLCTLADGESGESGYFPATDFTAVTIDDLYQLVLLKSRVATLAETKAYLGIS